MRIAVAGTGYVGLVTGACFADAGNHVTCFDINQARIDQLNSGSVPIYEPGLTDLVAKSLQADRLGFTVSCEEAVADAQVVFLAVGTPQSKDGSADLTAVFAVVDTLAQFVSPDCVVVTKSTVPVGTNRTIQSRFQQLLGDKSPHVASNPEFLREGCALKDFFKPDRVVVGVESEYSRDVLRRLYEPFIAGEAPLLSMGLESAEMTKYAANCFLAAKISFINEMANICDAVGADIGDVRQGMGHDHRIGFPFLFPGVGYGGSCFPKDVRALDSVARQNGYQSRILSCVDQINERQKSLLFRKIASHFNGALAGRVIAVWGLAFKPGTDDIREAPSLTLIDELLTAGASLRVHDPEAMDHVQGVFGDHIKYCSDALAAVSGADALACVTEWDCYRSPDWTGIRSQMKSAAVFDGRNVYSQEALRAAGFSYYGVGCGERPQVAVSLKVA